MGDILKRSAPCHSGCQALSVAPPSISPFDMQVVLHYYPLFDYEMLSEICRDVINVKGYVWCAITFIYIKIHVRNCVLNKRMNLSPNDRHIKRV